MKTWYYPKKFKKVISSIIMITKWCLLVLRMQLLMNPWLIVEMSSTWVFSIGITLVDAHLNWMNCFHLLLLLADLLVILIDSTIFLLPFLYVRRISMSTVSFLARLDSWNSLPVECFPLIEMARVNRRIFSLD